MENELIDKEEKIELKLKTICDYLLPTRFDEISVFSEFEKCFKPLFFNTNISLEVVFDYIVGTFENTIKLAGYDFNDIWRKFLANTQIDEKHDSAFINQIVQFKIRIFKVILQ